MWEEIVMNWNLLLKVFSCTGLIKEKGQYCPKGQKWLKEAGRHFDFAGTTMIYSKLLQLLLLLCQLAGGVGVLFESFPLFDQGFFQDDFSFFVALSVFQRELIHPAYFVVTVFTKDVPDPVSARKHDPLGPLAVVKVDDFVEEECPASSASEPGGDQLAPVGQERLAMDAAEQAEPAQVGQVVAPHDVSS